jgi:hypothetical protein
MNQELKRASSARNPYAPPQAEVHDVRGARPRQVRWAVTALWVAYGLTFLHAIFVLGERLLAWPLTPAVWGQWGFEVFYAMLISLIAGGRFAALLLYAVLLAARTFNVIWRLADDWDYSPALVGVTALSFILQYLALCWSLSAPGRRWFRGLPPSPRA